MHIGLNAHLLSSQPGYRSAGIHSYIDHLLRHLPAAVPADWQLTAMVGGANQAHYEGVTLRHARLDTESPLKRIVWEQITQPFQLGSFDLYHAMAFVAPLMLTKPMVVTVYDLTFMRYPERLSTARRLYLRALTARTCRRARRIIAISHSTARDLTDLLDVPPEKIDVTPLAYDSNVFRPLPPEEITAFRQRQGLPDRFWLYLGTIEPRKNLTTLLEAYAQLSPSARPLLVLAGGKGWQYEDVYATIDRHNLNDSVLLPGFIPADDVPFWYNSAELFIYPSVFEGFGLPVLEAMACGTPVITSNVSSLPEVAGEVGLCLPPHEVDTWRDALQRTFHDTAWRDAARTTGLQAARAFTWARTTQLTVESYRRAVQQ